LPTSTTSPSTQHCKTSAYPRSAFSLRDESGSSLSGDRSSVGSAIAGCGIPFHLVPFIVILALDLGHPVLIPGRVAVRPAGGLGLGLRLLPLQPAHGFGIVISAPFLIPVSWPSAWIRVVGRGTITPRHGLRIAAAKAKGSAGGRKAVSTGKRSSVR